MKTSSLAKQILQDFEGRLNEPIFEEILTKYDASSNVAMHALREARRLAYSGNGKVPSDKQPPIVSHVADYIRNSDQELSAAKIAHEFGVSESTVWRAKQQLRDGELEHPRASKTQKRGQRPMQLMLDVPQDGLDIKLRSLGGGMLLTISVSDEGLSFFGPNAKVGSEKVSFDKILGIMEIVGRLR